MLRKAFCSRTGTALVALLVMLSAGTSLYSQDAPPPPPPPGENLSPNQLDDLVAPIALYPDPLLSQVLVAATYPLEVVEASQWLQKNQGLSGTDLTQAAQQQNWDPSVQALVVFPDVIKRLTDDVTWTTNLGNTFLAQQQDVMDAVQRMRQRAQQAGKLASTPQENVVTENENGQPYVEITPTDPDVIYVPAYDPVWVWGPPIWYPYPRWYYPPRSVIVGGLGFGFYGGINVGLLFGGGWGVWGGWGWHPGWGNHTVIVNNTFIHRYNFNTAGIRDVHGSSVWAHDSVHRQGVPYASPGLQQRYRGGENFGRFGGQPARPAEGQRFGNPPANDQRFGNAPANEQRGGNAPGNGQRFGNGPGNGERFGNRQIPQNVPPAQNRTVFGGMQNSGEAARQHADHGYSSMGPARSMPAPRSAPPPRQGGGGGGGGRRGH